MVNIVESLRIQLDTLKAEQARKHDARRGTVSSANFFWLMDQVRAGKTTGEWIDPQGNKVELQTIELSTGSPRTQLVITERIPEDKTLGLHTVLEIREGGKSDMSASIRIIQVDTKKPVSSASVFLIKKTPNNSRDLRYDKGHYESLDGNFSGLGYTTVLQPGLFKETVGRAYSIAFNLLARKGEPKPLEPLDLNKNFPHPTNS